MANLNTFDAFQEHFNQMAKDSSIEEMAAYYFQTAQFLSHASCDDVGSIRNYIDLQKKAITVLNDYAEKLVLTKLTTQEYALVTGSMVENVESLNHQSQIDVQVNVHNLLKVKTQYEEDPESFISPNRILNYLLAKRISGVSEIRLTADLTDLTITRGNLFQAKCNSTTTGIQKLPLKITFQEAFAAKDRKLEPNYLSYII